MEVNKYQQGKIYKLISSETDKIYIGSTCKKYLSQRLQNHKADYKLWKKNRERSKKITSFDLLELGDVEIILLETYSCNSKDELIARERYWMEQNKEIIINKNRPIVSKEEKKEYWKQYCEENKEQKKEYLKQYNETNKEQIKEQRKQYCEANKEQIKEQKKQYNEVNKEQIKEHKKQYREANKEQIKEHKKQYREANKEQIKEKKKEKGSILKKCEICNCEIRTDYFTKHLKTILHKNNLVS